MAISTENWNEHWQEFDVNRMVLNWVYEKDDENNCYKIYTKDKVIKIDDVLERQHIANVFSKRHAHMIVLYHNYFNENDYPI
jgi:hypothetical protein